MKDVGQLLEDYESVLQLYRSIIEKELENLKNTGQLDPSLETEKQQVIEELTGNLSVLKLIRESGESLDTGLRSRLNQLQQKFMQVIKLERELEKSYLGQQSSRADTVRTQAKGGINFAAARRLYGMS